MQKNWVTIFMRFEMKTCEGKMKLWKFVGCLWSGKIVDFVGWNVIIGGTIPLKMP